MALIKRVALSSDDPAAAADFYERVFGLGESLRKPKGARADGLMIDITVRGWDERIRARTTLL